MKKKRDCRIKNGVLYCKIKGKWKEVSKENIKIQSKPFKVKKSFVGTRKNVC